MGGAEADLAAARRMVQAECGVMAESAARAAYRRIRRDPPVSGNRLSPARLSGSERRNDVYNSGMTNVDESMTVELDGRTY
jgi:hypothetical protein